MSTTLSIVDHYEMFLRILISALLGFLIGWDRESKSKPAGLKTYMYVSVASTLLTLISIYSVEKFSSITPRTQMDPMRLTAQIVAGLGFLGAGVILKDGLQVKGLTSAAMILFVGGVGIGIGAGFYAIVIFTVAVSMIMAKIGNVLERRKLMRSKTQINSLNNDVEHHQSM
jgi:putative Mg2+ transporter-C (MgtC) family protein